MHGLGHTFAAMQHSGQLLQASVSGYFGQAKQGAGGDRCWHGTLESCVLAAACTWPDSVH